MAAMEVDASTDGGAQEQPRFPLNLIALIRTEQGQNGVKHGDYKRYRRHCKNKLQSLYKALKFQHGRTKYIKRKVETATVTDVRFLHIPLFSAERAWAYAMEIKKEIEGDMNLAKRRHLVARMRKAAAWARDVARLAAARCDARGAVEAEGYAAFLAASALTEREKHWQRALALLLRARHIFTRLSSLGGSPEQQSLYLQQVDEMEPAIRFCKYQISRQGGTAPNDQELLAAAQQEPEVLPAPQLDGHLASLVQEQQAAAGDTAAAGSSNEGAAVSLEWLGRTLPVRGDRLKAAVQLVHTLEAQLTAQQQQPQGMQVDASEGQGTAGAAQPLRQALHEKLLRALTDARTHARTAIKSAAVGEGDGGHDELVAVEAALTGMLAAHHVELAELQAQQVEDRFAKGLERAAAAAGAGKKSAAKDAKAVRPEEVVACLDVLSRGLAELADVGARGGGRAGEALYEQAAAKTACVKAARTYYTGHILLGEGKQLEAYALFERAAEHARQAAEEAPDATYKAYCGTLATNADAFKCVSRAEYAACVAAQREGVEAGLGGLGLEQQAAATAAAAAAGAEPATQWLMDALDSWESFAGQGKPPRIYQLPFRMQAIPCRPIMLDTASSWVAYPSLDHRKPQPEKKGVLSSLAGWAGWGAKK